MVAADEARYVDLGRIATGGMAEVHVAYREGPGGFRKIVAVKRVLGQFADDPSFERLFLNEANLAAGLEHSNLAKVLDFGKLGGRYFIAMEYVHGVDVRAVLHRAAKESAAGVLPLESALYIVRSVAAGLHYAHERCDENGQPLGLVHRDVSPSNILLSYDGDVKLADFGIAKATSKHDATATTTLRGKLAYMSPEHARSQLLDRRSDVYALGVVLFELTTGFRQFTADNQYLLLNRVADGAVTMPTELVPEYPAALEAIVARALAFAPEDRFATALELHDALGEFAASHGLQPDGPRLGQELVSLFGRRAMPIPDDEGALTTKFGSVSRPGSTVPGPPPMSPAPPPRGRGRTIAIASLIGGVALGLGLAQAFAGGPDPTPQTVEQQDAAPPVAVAPDEKTDAKHPEDAAPKGEPASVTASRPRGEPARVATPSPAPDPDAEHDRNGPAEPSNGRRRPKRRTAKARRDSEGKPAAVKSKLDDWSLPKSQN